MVTPTPKAIDSPAEPVVCTMLFSRIVARRKPNIREKRRKSVIESTATGIDAETVMPTFSTRYSEEAPKMIPSTAPTTTAGKVNSGMHAIGHIGLVRGAGRPRLMVPVRPVLPCCQLPPEWAHEAISKPPMISRLGGVGKGDEAGPVTALQSIEGPHQVGGVNGKRQWLRFVPNSPMTGVQNAMLPMESPRSCAWRHRYYPWTSKPVAE